MTGAAALPNPGLNLAVDATAAAAAAAATAVAEAAAETAARTGPGQASSAEPTEGGSGSAAAGDAETLSNPLQPVRTVSSSRAAGRDAVSITALLQLHPKHLEAELWQSACAVR
jgi:hypothetical protein